MPNAPRRRLAYPKRFGQANRGQPLVRLKDQPQRFEPGAQRQFGGVQWRARRRRELETASAIGALVETRPCSISAHVAPRQRDRTLVTTRRTNPPIRPHQGFHQSSAPLLVAKRFNHLRDRSDPQQHLADRVRHHLNPPPRKPLESHEKTPSSSNITDNAKVEQLANFERSQSAIQASSSSSLLASFKSAVSNPSVNQP